MKNIRKYLFVIYLPITFLFLILDNFYPGESFVNYIKFATIITLFLVAFSIKKKYPEQKLMNLAIFFIIIGDFFLVYCGTIPELSDKVVPFGMIRFILAYLSLIVAFQKNFKIAKGELLALVLVIFIPNFIKLYPHITGAIFYGATIFSFVLCYMT
ncbi:MAG: lysoplasmalogenase family protein [Clostridia bacterium]|nr:lysoplasmalogenase family protein [Clostridia bacterium]